MSEREGGREEGGREGGREGTLVYTLTIPQRAAGSLLDCACYSDIERLVHIYTCMHCSCVTSVCPPVGENGGSL